MSINETPRRPIPPLSSGGPTLADFPPARQVDPLFDAASLTQGGQPHLIQFLTQEYRDYIARANEQRAQHGKEPLDAEKTLKRAQPMLAFFEAYLKQHRPTSVFPIDMNYGIQLSNYKTFALSPGVETDFRGTTQESVAVAVTHGRSQPGSRGSFDSGGIGI